MKDHEMLVEKSLTKFLDELASGSPAPGGGSVAALCGALGAGLTAMVCNLTIGKKKYLDHEAKLKHVLEEAEKKRRHFTELIDRDTRAFNKVIEAYTLPKDTEAQKALRAAAIQGATKEAALVPLEVMRHAIDTLAVVRAVAEKGNVNSTSDAGVSALMLHAACESAALNVQVNLKNIADTEFVGWRTEEVNSLLRTSKTSADEILSLVRGKILS